MMKNFRQTNLRREGFQSLLQPWSSRSAAAQHVYARAQSADRGAAAQTDNGQSRRTRAGGRRWQRHEGHLRRQGVRVALRSSAPRAVLMVHCASCDWRWSWLRGPQRGPRLVARARSRASAAGCTLSWTSVELGGAVAGGMLRKVTNEPGLWWRRTQAQQADMTRPGGRRARSVR